MGDTIFRNNKSLLIKEIQVNEYQNSKDAFLISFNDQKPAAIISRNLLIEELNKCQRALNLLESVIKK